MPVEILGLVPFEIVKEPWNEYVIKDDEDVVLRGRLILSKMTRIRDPTDQKRMGIQVAPHPIWTTHSPPALRGKASEKLPHPAEIAENEKKQVEVETRKETWNVYRVAEDKAELRLRLVVGRVYRALGHYAVDGEPYYLVDSTVIAEVSKTDRSTIQAAGK